MSKKRTNWVSVTCKICGKTEEVAPSRARTYHTCSRACGATYASQRLSQKVDVTCATCGKVFKLKRHEALTRKNCSRACFKIYQAKKMAGEGNHQFGKRGPERGNAYKGGRRLTSWGYIAVLLPEGGYELEHRLVMENHLGRKLSKNEHVHHKNEIRTDNRLENLELLTKSEHVALHNKELSRGSENGKFKSLEGPKMDTNTAALSKRLKAKSSFDEVKSPDDVSKLGWTARGTGGFGSTGK